jgi:hypothetical protein
MAEPLEITDEIRDLINGALVGGYPVLLAVVGPTGEPRLSFRGSLQVFSKDQLGFWARNTGGETMDAIKANPKVAMMLRKPEPRSILQLTGRARVAAGAERDRVYDLAPEYERAADAEKKGAAVIIDLDRIGGILPGGEGIVRVDMARG